MIDRDDTTFVFYPVLLPLLCYESSACIYLAYIFVFLLKYQCDVMSVQASFGLACDIEIQSAGALL